MFSNLILFFVQTKEMPFGIVQISFSNFLHTLRISLSTHLSLHHLSLHGLYDPNTRPWPRRKAFIAESPSLPIVFHFRAKFHLWIVHDDSAMSFVTLTVLTCRFTCLFQHLNFLIMSRSASAHRADWFPTYQNIGPVPKISWILLHDKKFSKIKQR